MHWQNYPLDPWSYMYYALPGLVPRILTWFIFINRSIIFSFPPLFFSNKIPSIPNFFGAIN